MSHQTFSEPELECLRDGKRLGETEEQRHLREEAEKAGRFICFSRRERRKWGWWVQ